MKPGERLRSQVCEAEVMVIRPSEAVDLTCGGHPMVAMDDAAERQAAVPGLDGGCQLGKRYTATADPGLELLVTKAGSGTLADGEEPLVVKEAKPLPSSD